MKRRASCKTLVMVVACLMPSIAGMILACLWNGGWGVKLPSLLVKIAVPFGLDSMFYAMGAPSRFTQAIVVGMAYIPIDLLVLLCFVSYKIAKLRYMRKIFFWDSPEIGAFWGLTIIPVSIWLLFSVLCTIAVVDFYFLLVGSTVTTALKICMVSIWLYAAFLVGRLLVLSCIVHRNPIFLSWKFIAGTVLWVIALLVFRSLATCALRHPIVDYVPCVNFLGHRVRLDTAWVSICLTALAFSMLATGYCLYWSLLADHSGLPMHMIFGSAVRILLSVVVISYIVFCGLSLFEIHSYRHKIKELEAFFGRPLSCWELSGLFYSGHSADSAYWEKLKRQAIPFFKLEETHVSYRIFYKLQPNVLPDEPYEQWSTFFKESDACRKLEMMLDNPIPKAERNYAENKLLMSESFQDLQIISKVAVLEMSHILYALEIRNIDEALESLERLDVCGRYLENDNLPMAYSLWLDIVHLHTQAVEKMLDSGLLPINYLKEQFRILNELECLAEEKEGAALHGSAIFYLNVFHWLANYSGAQDGIYQSLNFHALRFFFPQGWWLVSNNAKNMAKYFHIHHFHEMASASFREYLGVDITLSNIGIKKNRFIEASRALKELIQADLLKRDTDMDSDVLSK